jgi:hypothetical protein
MGFIQDAVAKVLIFVLALAAKLYDALRDHLAGFDRAVGDLKGRANIVERVRHGSRRVRYEHVDRSHFGALLRLQGQKCDLLLRCRLRVRLAAEKE